MINLCVELDFGLEPYNVQVVHYCCLLLLRW